MNADAACADILANDAGTVGVQNLPDRVVSVWLEPTCPYAGEHAVKPFS